MDEKPLNATDAASENRPREFSKEFLAKPIRRKDLDGILGAIAEPIRERFARLEQRIAELEARGYQGVYDSQKEYQSGAMVTDDGSVWHANIKLKGVRPGTSPLWTLAVKRGKDGRAAR